MFTHSSWAPARSDSYERLEFLGDSVLELAVARMFEVIVVPDAKNAEWWFKHGEYMNVGIWPERPATPAEIERLFAKHLDAVAMSVAGRSRSLAFSDNSQAVVTMNIGFRNSDGWNCAMPTPIQRRAPLISTPIKGVTARIAIRMPVPSTAMRRAVTTGSIETTNNTGSETPTHITCRQK